MLALVVGLPGVDVLGVEDDVDGPIGLLIEKTAAEAVLCGACGSTAWVNDRRTVELVDLPAFGRPTRLWWRKRRFRCSVACGRGTWTEADTAIAWPRFALTDRAGRWVTRQVGRHGRAVSDVAAELGCDWHTRERRRDGLWHRAHRRRPGPDRRRDRVGSGRDAVL